MARPTDLNERQRAFIREYLRNGGNGAAAARAAGYSKNSPSSARRQALQLLNIPIVADAIANGREDFQIITAYDAKAFMAELDAGAEFAIKTNNATALARFRELKGRAAGLLDQKIDINLNSQVDVASALEAAHARVQLGRVRFASEAVTVDYIEATSQEVDQ